MTRTVVMMMVMVMIEMCLIEYIIITLMIHDGDFIDHDKTLE